MSKTTVQSEKNLVLFHLFNALTFLLGLFFRLAVAGWILIFYAILEIPIRLTYAISMLILINRTKLKKTIDLFLYFSTTFLYLLVSLFTIDMSDQTSYTLMQYWKSPPSWMFSVYYSLLGIFLLLLVGVIMRNIDSKEYYKER